MKRVISVVFVLFFIGLFFFNCGKKAPVITDYPVEAVPLTQVDITDEFWAPRQEANRTVSIQHCILRNEERGRVGIDGRLLEGAAYMIAKRPDAAFEAYIKERVDKTLEASAARKTGAGQVPRAGGTSAEGAVAYFEATGDRRLLDAAIQAADLMDQDYGPAKKAYISGHEGMKIGLIKLFRHTGDQRYWKLANFLLDIRGREEYQKQTAGEYPGDREYNQNHKPVIEQTEAVGHCVRATYLYIPLTDIAALTGQPEYDKANDAIWQDVVSKKMYLTGGIGSIRQQEKFGAAYELPNLSAWHETCASYGNVLWNHRLFLLHKDAKFIDTMERILYNGFNVGVSLKGDRFFYQNSLISYGTYERFDWINVPCCPPNVVRLMASLGSYIYAKTGNEIYVNLFVDSKADVALVKNKVKITQETRYPWEGNAKLTVEPERSGRFAILVRIPGWAQNTPVPSDLYMYLDPTDEKPVLNVNGKPVKLKLKNGYVRLERRWKKGDAIELVLPMPVHKVLAHPMVRDDVGRVALERGPLVYCAEWPDNGGSALNIVIPDNAPLKAEFRTDLLNGVEVLTGEVSAVVRGEDGVAVKTAPHNLVAIPYYAWANRGMGEMAVWMARAPETARIKPIFPEPVRQVTSFAGIEKYWTGYNDQNDDICAVYDGVEPLNSADESHLYFRMRPPEKKPAWVEYDFKSPTEVSSSQVFFVDDRRFCRLPASWQILYKSGNTWKPVVNRESYAVEKNKFNAVTFDPVKTSAIRLEVEPQNILYKAGAAGPPAAVTINKDVIWREFGIIEWRVK
jgi:DUF1680 family protein